MLETNGFQVLNVVLFPINWGMKALNSQLDVCDFYLNEVPLTQFMTSSKESYSLHSELRYQVQTLRNYLKSSELKDMGICFAFNWVIVAQLTNYS